MKSAVEELPFLLHQRLLNGLLFGNPSIAGPVQTGKGHMLGLNAHDLLKGASVQKPLEGFLHTSGVNPFSKVEDLFPVDVRFIKAAFLRIWLMCSFS
ncbi:MAG: hypothetical protein ACUVSA_08335 [Desulfosoma sp.]|uniref:hypothetical protein n=1 Tax=Desulfosoma sp. TaxID=2603217 RepID=UPI00404903C7